MTWKVLITARAACEAGAQARQLLEQVGCELTIADTFGPLDVPQLAAALTGHDAVIASADAYSAGLFARSETHSLKCVSRWGVGVDCVDLAAATQAGVVVCNTPGLLDEAVADYAWALLFAVARKVTAGERSMEGGDWSIAWGHDIHGKTLGIIGCGRIGQAVARRAAGFGMRVLGHDPYAQVHGDFERVELDELLQESDFVSLHCSLTDENRGMLSAERLCLMKPSAYLINTARGALVDETALVACLRAGHLAGAALDAFANEPLPASSPLRNCPRLVLTPHQAFNSSETGEKVSLAAATAIVDLLQGRRPANVVNPDVLASDAARVSLQSSTTPH
jgi:phosphoglycerate dehydrogenase-like enzyme